MYSPRSNGSALTPLPLLPPEYRLVAKKGEGTFSEVLKAQCIKNGKYVAIKCMKSSFESLDQVNNLREIQALKRLSPHPNIVKLLEVRSTAQLGFITRPFWVLLSWCHGSV